tara:strand:- start:3950 stop:5698 length:1749 start_codon:yes stop_codon:yes gene_type:complete
MTKTSVIIQARLGSKRLPKKILKKINGKTILEYVISQVRSSKLVDEIIIATTRLHEDDKIIQFCKKNKIKFFRGSENDLLDRYYKCAKKNSCRIIVRITSDCPLIDPKIIDNAIRTFQENSYDYVSNNIEKINDNWENSTCNFPQGMTVEVTNMETLSRAWKLAKKNSEREHVFPYVQFNPKKFSITNIKNSKKLDMIRCTIDRPQDLKFLKKLIDNLPNKSPIHISDIEKTVLKHPSIKKINKNILFDEGYRLSLQKEQKIFFVVDGNNKIGLGHVHQSLNLAKELKKSKKNIVFTSNDKIVKKFIPKTFPCYISKQKTFKKRVNPSKNDLIIIDKHQELKKNLIHYKKNSKLLIGIDYFGNGKEYFSKGINILYQKSGIKGHNSYSGFKYAILNKNFRNTKPIVIKNTPRSLVILQGGTDSNCYIPKILSSLLEMDLQLKITIIGNFSSTCEQKLKKIISKSKTTILIKKNVKSMNNELVKHDIAITGGGMTMLELCYIGIPSIIICTEKFENETAKEISSCGFGINLGFQQNISNKRIKKTLSGLLENKKLRIKMNKIGPKIIDSKGSSRVSNLIEGWV